MGVANEKDRRGNHGTDNVLRYATLLREIVTQFDSEKNEPVIWELSLSPLGVFGCTNTTYH